MSIKTIAISLVLVMMSSCWWGETDESVMVGAYKVADYDLTDSSETVQLPILRLNKNKTFVISYPRYEIGGKWNGYDDGDHIWVNLKSDKEKDEGWVYGLSEVSIDFGAPSEFYFPRFKHIVFKQVK